MEHEFEINTPDKHIIYGVLNTSKTKSKKLIIFVHGFTGHAYEHVFHNAARFFPERGFDTFRFNFYWYEKDARKLTETTMTEHTEDLKLVFNQFKDEYTDIYAVGHSIGAQVVIRTDSKFKAAVLWDPSWELNKLAEELEYSKGLDAYIDHSNVDIVIGKNFVEDAKTLTPTKEILPSLHIPLKIIGAELGNAKVAEELYYENADEPKQFSRIAKAGHTFDEGETEQELFFQTLGWFEQY